MLTKPCDGEYGFIGLVPKNTAAGDLVCLLKGCSKRIVLRETESADGKPVYIQDSRRYQVIGESFVELNAAGQVVAEKALADKDPNIAETERLQMFHLV
jgi:hypothetical protein